MRTILFYIPHRVDVLGLDLTVFGTGWLLVIWIVACAALVGWLFRKKREREAFSLVPVLAIIALAIVFVLPMLEERAPGGNELPIGLAIRGYGMAILCGVVVAVGLAAYRARRMGIAPETIFSLAFWTFLAGIAGSRVWYAVQYWDERFAQFDKDGNFLFWETLQMFASFTQGGLVVYGGLVGGVIASLIFLYRRKLPPLAIGDLVVPSLGFGLALGRIGCFMNGCCFGGICEPPSSFHSLAVTFPNGEAWSPGNPYPTTPHDSPPYATQKRRGQLYWFQLAKDKDGNPVVAHVDSRITRFTQSGELKAGDRIRRINGQEIPPNSKRAKSSRQDAYDEALDLVGRSGHSLQIETQDGRKVLIDVGRLPGRSRPIHPTQLYSAVNAALMGAFLWFYYPFRRRDGEVFALMLTLYPIARMLLEFIRSDESGQFGTSFTISQWFSVVMMLVGAILWIYLRTRPKGTALPLKPAST